MKRQTMGALTGAAITMAVGTAAYLVSTRTTKSQRRKIRHTADRAMRTVGNVVDNIQTMMH